MEKESKVGHFLRVGVKGGGCSGFSYFLEFVEDQKDNDACYEFSGLKVLCDPKSLNFIAGIELDYDTNLLNGGFKFNNPQSRKSCSCGESFSV